MRVIAGSARGRILKHPNSRGPALRPTQDAVREAIFNLLGIGPFSGTVLDLFSGTGAMGVEALSRGFGPAVFVERDRQALKLVTENLSRVGLGEHARIEACEVMRFLSRIDSAAPFSLVLLDPPYHQGAVRPVLEALGCAGWLTPEAQVVAESEHGLALPESIGCLRLHKDRRYGDTHVWIFTP